MSKLRTYLNVAGDAEAAMGLYRSVFGGEFSALVRFRDMPIDRVSVPAADPGKIMHVSLRIGEDAVLLASDTLRSLGQELKPWEQRLHLGERRRQDGSRPALLGARGGRNADRRPAVGRLLRRLRRSLRHAVDGGLHVPDSVSVWRCPASQAAAEGGCPRRRWLPDEDSNLEPSG